MALLENPILPEDAKSLQCDDHLKNHLEVFVPIVAECIIDGALVGSNCVNPGECGLKDGAYPPENLIDSCHGEKAWEKSEVNHGVLDLKSGCPKELLDSSVLLEPKGVVAMDLLGKGDQGLGLETGKEIKAGDGTIWASAKRLFGKTLKSFIQRDFGHSFDSSIAGTKTVEPTYSYSAKVDICKPVVNPLKSEVAIQKSVPKNGRNVRIAELVGSEKLRHENGNRHIKPSSKKPPRPPRPPRPPKETTDPSKDKLLEVMLRRAKLERIISLKKKQIAKSKPSNSSVWALTLTLCFCVVMIMQVLGMFSQGNGGAQISAEVAIQTSTLSVQKYANHAMNAERLHAKEADHVVHEMPKAGTIQSDPKS